MDRIKELIKILNTASNQYYNGLEQSLSDFQYDKLYDELVQLEQETGIIFANSPTQKVGFDVVSNLNKVTHSEQMLSLDKTKSIDSLVSFIGDEEGLLSWKLDGLTVVLKYENGYLVQGVTRGNGTIGEDITHNVKTFSNIPLKIKTTDTLYIRGEAIITFSEFEKINENLGPDEKYKNPRNLCSGTVRQLNSQIVANRNVRFIAFSVINIENFDFENKKENSLLFLQKQGFETVQYVVVNKDNLESTVKYFENAIINLDYATDGLVLTFNSISYSKNLGSTSKFPKDSIALKWKDELATTILREVAWNTSRTGLINPVAIFDPVELEGTTVNRASLHNVSIIENLQLGLNDTITVYKANMIIPQIGENLTKSNTLEIPANCPVCGEKTEILQANDGKSLHCLNINCKAQLVQGLTHFVSRDAMNIDGLSESTIEKFVQNNLLQEYLDIFQLKNHEEIIVNMEGFGKKSYEKLINSIENCKSVKIFNFIYALGINQVGLSNSKLLAKKFDYDLERIMNATYEELMSIDGFGDVICQSLVDFFQCEKNKNNVLALSSQLNFIEIKPSVNTLENTTFAITGTTEIFENRKALQTLIESLGGKVSSSVSAKTTYLINNDNMSDSSKNKKAKELNIPILTETDFINRFGLQ